VVCSRSFSRKTWQSSISVERVHREFERLMNSTRTRLDLGHVLRRETN